jgi:uncharacterized membrane protein YkoI
VNRKLSNFTNLMIAFLMLSSPPIVLADDDHVEARRLRDSGEILPLEVILKNVRQAHPGNLLEVEIDTEDGRIVYEVEILGKDGVVKEIIIDATTGNLLFAREDD